MNGWVGKVLRVNLSQGNFAVEDLDPVMARDFIGGRGLGVKILYDEVDPKVDPFSPENKLVLATGPLTGTGAPASCRYMAVTKSPLTGAIAFSSSGEFFAPEMKFAGYDVIIVEGKAPRPTYVSINDSNVELKGAEHLWGKMTNETEDALKAEMGDQWTAREARICCIGPAGERLVRTAAIVNDKYGVAARSGVGAVMGSKNLKAIAVRGTRPVSLADGSGFKDTVYAFLDKLQKSDSVQSFKQNGTIGGSYPLLGGGSGPVRNYQRSTFDTAKNLRARVFRENFIVKYRACFACPITCKRITRVTKQEFEGTGAQVDNESLLKLGPDCYVDDPAAILKATYLCNELGMDTMSVGGTISCAMELFEKGYVTEKDVGYELTFGSGEALVTSVEKMGLRLGFGDILAEGGYRLAEKYGHPELFMGSKKQEFPVFSPAALQGVGLEYATSTRGACHNRANMVGEELVPLAAGRATLEETLSSKGKAALCIELQHEHAIWDSTGLCNFALLETGTYPNDFLRMIEAATGDAYSVDDLHLIGERIWNVEVLFNRGAGLTAADDSLPRRITEEPVSAGWAKGNVNRLNEMKPEYYRLRGYDEVGVPTPQKLAELGLT